MDRLIQAAEGAGIDIVTNARAETLLVDGDGRVLGVEIERPDGGHEIIGCRALVLACNGYGGNRELVARHIPQMASALYFGHPGNQGEAVIWGGQLGAALSDLSGHQGHGSVADPHGILISWATIVEGGFQVNLLGERFANEAQGYSEHAAAVLAQPEGRGWTIFDARIAEIARQFEDFRNAEAAKAILMADDIPTLAARTNLPVKALQSTFDAVEAAKAVAGVDAFGRDWRNSKPLAPPFAAVRVTGALFHTQGGLDVDGEARVLKRDGSSLPNLFAVGGAAAGVSGLQASGYLSGNGLLTAVSFGFLAGTAAARRAGS